MSDFTRAKKTSVKNKKQRSSPFVALSLVMHIGGLGLLMMYSPAREAVFGKAPPKPDPEIRLEGDALAHLTEQIRDINREQLVAAAMELSAIEEEMEDMRLEKAQEFAEVADERADEAVAKLDSVLAQVTAAQKTALEQQKQATDKSAEKEGARSAAAQQQSAAEIGQQSLTDILEYAGAADVLKKGQDAASAAQIQATRALASAKQAAANARNGEDDLKRKREEQAQQQQTVANERTLADQLRAKAQEADQRAKTAAADQQAKQTALTTAQATPKPTDKNAIRAHDEQVKRAREEAKKSQDQLNQANQQQRNAASELQRRETQLAAVETKARQVADDIQLADQKLATRDQEFAAKNTQAVALQEKANELQQASTDTVKQALAGGMKPGAHQLAGRRTLDSLRLYDSSIGEIYEHLVKSEKAIAQSYTELRATDLAMLTGVSPKRAMQQIDVPQPNRPQIDVAITKQKVTEGEQYKRHAEVVQTAVRESESIVTATQNMLDSARRSLAREGEGAGVDLSERARRLAAINKASHEEQGGQAVDLTALMRMQGGGAGPEAPKPETPAPLMGRGSKQPPQIRDVDITSPARIVVGDAPGAKWVYIDSWYTIGPFSNPGRANIHRVFPPESSVNLDAVYDGMFGAVKWQFIQSPRAMVVPANAAEYGIWYAYTEMQFDRECDLWTAIGSDDRSDIWINDVRIWSSSDKLKGWEIGEGLRKVHFAAGRNRILYRIENGWNSIGFSMCLYMGGQ